MTCKEEAVMKSFGGRKKCGGLRTHHQVHLGNMVIASFQQNRPTVWLGDILVESFGGLSYKYHVGPRKQSKGQKVFVWSR